MNFGIPYVQDGLRKGRGTKHQTANIHWIIEKARKLMKNTYLCFIKFSKVFDCVDYKKKQKQKQKQKQQQQQQQKPVENLQRLEYQTISFAF